MKNSDQRKQTRRAAAYNLVFSAFLAPLFLTFVIFFLAGWLGFSRETLEDWRAQIAIQVLTLPIFWYVIKFVCWQLQKGFKGLDAAAVARLSAAYYLAFDLVMTVPSLISSFSFGDFAVAIIEMPLYTFVMYIATKHYWEHFGRIEIGPAKIKREPKGLGGWLIFIVIGIVLSPFTLGYTLISLLGFFEDGEWIRIFDSMSAYYNPLFGVAILIEIFGYALLAAFTVYLIFLLFGKKKIFPRAALIFLVASTVLVFFEYIVYVLLLPSEEVSSQVFISKLVGLSIWGPYLFISRRVKNTFVN